MLDSSFQNPPPVNNGVSLPFPAATLGLEREGQEIGQRSAQGAAVMMGSRGLQVAVLIAATAVLARLLTPADFGLLAMSLIMLELVQSFKDFGLPHAAVQRHAIDHAQLSRLFWLNLGLGALTAALMAAAAPLLVWFFREPRLLSITFAVAVGLFVSMSSTLHVGLLRRQMRFGVLTAIELAGVSLGAAVGIVAALLGAGYWALIGQQLAMLIAQGVGPWLTCGWRPQWRPPPAEPNSVRAMFTYGRQASAARILTHLAQSADRLLLGRLAGAGPLGLYQSASRWAHFPLQQIQQPLITIAVSGLSRLQDDAPRYRAYCRQVMRALFVPLFPALAFLAVEGHAVVLLLLGPQWVEAVPLLRLLAVGAMAQAVGVATQWVYLSEGRTRRQFYWTPINALVLVAGVAIGAGWGPLGVAAGYAVAAVLLSYPAIAFCVRGSRLRLEDFGAALWRPVIGTTMAVAGLTLLQPLFPSPHNQLLLRLLTSGACFILLYSALWLGTETGRRELIGMVQAIRLLRTNRSSMPRRQ